MASLMTARDLVVVDLDPVDKPRACACFTLHPLNINSSDVREITLQAGDEIIVARTSRSGTESSTRPNRLNCRFESPVISRSHALIRFDGVQLSIKDTNSMHGTFINDQRVQPNTEVILKNGDVLRLGTQVHRSDASFGALEFHLSCQLTGVNPSAEDFVEDSMAADYAYHSDDADLDDIASTDHHEEVSSSAPTTPEKAGDVMSHIGKSGHPINISGTLGSQASPIFLEDTEEFNTKDNSAYAGAVIGTGNRAMKRASSDHQASYCDNENRFTTISDLDSHVEEAHYSRSDDSDNDDDEDEDDDSAVESDNSSDASDASEDEKSETYDYNALKTGEDERQQPSSAELNPAALALPPPIYTTPSTKVTSVLEESGRDIHNVLARPRYDPVRHSRYEQVSTYDDYVASSEASLPSVSEAAAFIQEQYQCGYVPLPSHLTFSEEAIIKDSFGESAYDRFNFVSEEAEPKTKIAIADLIDNEPSQHVDNLQASGAEQAFYRSESPVPPGTVITQDEVLTQDEVPNCITAAISSGRKRKADSMTDEDDAETPASATKKLVIAPKSVLDLAGAYDLACAARRLRRREAVRQAATKATHVAAGAMLGMVGTVVFLSSTYAERLIEWLG